MTKNLSAVLAALLLTLGARTAGAVDENAGTSGAAFLKIGMGSARAMAMGKAYVALAEGAEAMTWNPAGLATAQQREASYSYLRYVQGVDSPFFMAYAHPLGRTVLGVNAAYLSVDGFERRDALGRELDSSNVRVRDGFLTFSAARSFWYEKLFVGGSVKNVREDNAGTIHNTVVGDLGFMIKPRPSLSFGFSTQNFGAGRLKVAPVNRIGGAVRLFDLLTTSLELSKPSDGRARLGLGAEFVLPEDFLQVGQVALRVGYHGTDDMGRVLEQDRSFLYPLVGSPKISYGIGLYTTQAFGYGIGFDYALLPMGALGNVDQISLKVKF